MHQDYILRMIEQLSGVVRRVLRLRDEGEHDAALTEVTDAYGRIAGLPATLVHALSEENLIAMLRSQGRLDPERCFVLAELLREEALVYEAMANEAESAPRFRKALRLYLEAFEDPTDLPAALDVSGLEDLIDRLGDQPLPEPTRRRVINYLVLTGRFDRAENILLWHLELPDLSGEARREAVAFYEALLRKPDHELAEGGLPREEVEAGLERLRRHPELPPHGLG
ncbi:MAG: hypothetical protein C4346_08520 [Chloroflexota bacterium]